MSACVPAITEEILRFFGGLTSSLVASLFFPSNLPAATLATTQEDRSLGRRPSQACLG
jgi:hypothetical protein